MSVRGLNALLSLISLSAGGSLYMLFRTNSYIGVLVEHFDIVAVMREWVKSCSCDVLKFYLPDMLWGFSLSCGLLVIMGPGKRNVFLCGIVALACGIGWEGLQLCGVVSGTGDWVDVLMYLLASMAFYLINLYGVKEK